MSSYPSLRSLLILLICCSLLIFPAAAETVNESLKMPAFFSDIQNRGVDLHATDETPVYTVMHPSSEQLKEWDAQYNALPLVSVPATGSSSQLQNNTTSVGGYKDLLPYLDYIPAERNQGSIGNCWVWAGTGVMEIAHAVQNGVKDRFSISYLDANYNGGSGNKWAGTGGDFFNLANFYTTTGIAVPWSNLNAEYQDGTTWSGTEQRSYEPAFAISTEPHYQIYQIKAQRIETRHIGNEQAISNIKAVLDQNRAIGFGFNLPNSTAWGSFIEFFMNSSEETAWNMTPWQNTLYNENEGGGHEVLCVGYNDTDPTNRYWIMVNSWGVSDGHPRGVFRVSMDMDYSATMQFRDNDDWAALVWQTLDVNFAATPSPAPKEISSLPYTCSVPGEYYLAKDLISSDADTGILVTAQNVTIDGKGHLLRGSGRQGSVGILAYNNGDPVDGLNITNLAISNWEDGCYLYHATNGSVNDTTISDCSYAGIFLDGETTNLAIADNTLTSNYRGLLSRSTADIRVEHNRITESLNTGLYLLSMNQSLIADNQIVNGQNVIISGWVNTTSWNTSKTTGQNLAGGPYLGGNYWGNPTQTGFSDLAVDQNRDGFADSPNQIAAGTMDQFPLVAYANPGPQPIPPNQLDPTDPDHDRLYEDLNGNGKLDFGDVTTFFNQMDWIADHEPVQLFDFNGNQQIDFGDVAALFSRL
ncbi:NosD domain-containing protein [Methanosphaerula palustris]|uniref:Probable pectate lyase C n=1 Tax=Methanosphaerula palustris (strain ATCC BAA-1556 / DSM 19958 / E1-9c) TaxID=521011 RepID=B8GGV0_METPE|nr:NosD domain-containing protein [Methanosphaerula palustris]ACL16355.1 periplasmic copper-binding [Methanosphaerula palustris E1-9c]